MAHGRFEFQMIALLVNVLLQLLRNVAEHAGHSLCDLALVVGIEKLRNEFFETAVEEDRGAADAEQLGHSRIDVNAGTIEGLFLFEQRHLAIAVDAHRRIFFGALGNVRQDDNAAGRRLRNLVVLVDLARDFLVLLVELLIDHAARVAAENHVRAVLLLPDRAGMPKAVFIDRLENQRVLLGTRFAEEVPFVRRRNEFVDVDELFMMSRQQRIHALLGFGCLCLIRWRCRCCRLGHQGLQLGEAFRRDAGPRLLFRRG